MQEIFTEPDVAQNVLTFLDLNSRLRLKSTNKLLNSFIFGLHDSEWRLKIHNMFPLRDPATPFEQFLPVVLLVEKISKNSATKDIKCIDLKLFGNSQEEGK